MSARWPRILPIALDDLWPAEKELPGLAFSNLAQFFVDDVRLRRADRLSDRDEAVCTGLRAGLPPVRRAGDRRLGWAIEVLHDRVWGRRGPAVCELCGERLAAEQAESQGGEHAGLQTAETIEEHRGRRHREPDAEPRFPNELGRPEELACFRAADAGTVLPGGEQIERGEVEREVEQLRQPVRLVQVVAGRDRVEECGDVRLSNEHAFRPTRATGGEQEVGGSLRTASRNRDLPF